MIDLEVLEREDPEHDCDRAATDRNCGVAGTPLRPGRHVGDEAAATRASQSRAARSTSRRWGDRRAQRRAPDTRAARCARPRAARGVRARASATAASAAWRRCLVPAAVSLMSRRWWSRGSRCRAMRPSISSWSRRATRLRVQAEGAAELAPVGGPALLEPVEDRELMPGHPQCIQGATQALARHSGDRGQTGSRSRIPLRSPCLSSFPWRS